MRHGGGTKRCLNSSDSRSPRMWFGPGLSIAHRGTIVVNSGARVGANCRLHVCVNIGTKAGYGEQAPVLGDNVYVGPGAKLYGSIVVGNNVAIGANAVVNKSFPQDNVVLAGVPALGGRGVGCPRVAVPGNRVDRGRLDGYRGIDRQGSLRQVAAVFVIGRFPPAPRRGGRFGEWSPRLACARAAALVGRDESNRESHSVPNRARSTSTERRTAREHPRSVFGRAKGYATPGRMRIASNLLAGDPGLGFTRDPHRSVCVRREPFRSMRAVEDDRSVPPSASRSGKLGE